MTEVKSREARRRSRRYGRMFSMLFFGLFFLGSGIIGLDIRRQAEQRWAGRSLFWQVVVGLVMVSLGVYWSRRLDDPRLHRPSSGPPPIKHAGSGRSAGAEMAGRERLEP